jgi:CoA-transferase family III/3-hydroxyacyl-CoA dehydrogenase, NAD binding domain
MARALADADFVQENAPERPDFKIKLFAEMDAATPVDSILASSSSGITMDVIQSACKHPERCVIGHPFNPPHIIPLVEIVGGAKTSPATIERAKWETINGRPPSAWDFAGSPFLRFPLFRETRDGRHVVALDFYPKLRARTLNFLRCSESSEAIAGAAIGRDLAYYGADVLNIWRPNDSEIEAFAWDVQVGMRSTILDDSKEDRARFDQLISKADVFFANKRPGFLKLHGLEAEDLCARKPGLIHATVVLHGTQGPWSNRAGFDEIGATVAGLFALEGTLRRPKQPPIVPICDNVVGWLGTIGVLAALRRRATEGGSYRVVVSLTRTVLWLLSLGIFDKTYAQATAGSTEEHSYAAPDLFTAETPLGTYQGMTDQVLMSRTPGAFNTVLVPRGSSKPEWLGGRGEQT